MQNKVLFYGALSGADLLRKTPPDRYVFNYRAGLAREGAAAVRYLVKVRRVSPRRIAVLVQMDDFGESGWRGAVRELESSGVGREQILKLGYPRNTADVRDAVAQLRKRPKAHDAVVMVATYKPAATFVIQAKEAGLNLFFISVSADSNGLAEDLVAAGRRYTEKVAITQVVPVPSSLLPGVTRYRQLLEKHALAEKPGSTTLEAWVGAQILLEALSRAGRDLDGEKVVEALESIRGLDVGIGGVIDLGPGDHQGSDTVWGWLLQPDGTYRQIDLG
jgi:ABC-type branched-subunit amino acid transport system substrate-binding protein